jgi:hypothetical protein
VNFVDILVNFVDILVNFVDILVNFFDILANFVDILGNFFDILLNFFDILTVGDFDFGVATPHRSVIADNRFSRHQIEFHSSEKCVFCERDLFSTFKETIAQDDLEEKKYSAKKLNKFFSYQTGPAARALERQTGKNAFLLRLIN